jgi:beta-galactosidase
MDYLGEAGVGATAPIPIKGFPYYVASWPWVNAWCGDIDLIGDQKAPSRYRDVVWGVSKLEMAVQWPLPNGMKEFISNWGWSDELPSWSWPGQEGKPMMVRLYTAGDRVELLLNGAKVGEKAMAATDKLQAELTVPYAAGILEAVAYSGGREIARKRLTTVGAAARLRLRPERLRGSSDRRALSYVAIDVIDAAGRLLPDDMRKIALSIEGPAELVGFGSANPHAVGSFQATEAQSYRGRALAILRGTGRSGAVQIAARSEGIASAAVTLQLA